MASLTAVLIPAYDPPEGFYALISDILKLNHDLLLVVVDDGSDQQLDMSRLSDLGAKCIRHSANQGKGAALKTGFNYISSEFPDVLSVVTVDADGQHAVEDVGRIVSMAERHHDSFVLGVRGFGDDVPLRSAFGNTVTRKIFTQVTGTDIQDTQTGLRAYPIRLAADCCSIRSDRYDFEMKSLLHALQAGVVVEQVPITTLYEEGNRSSHFRPLVDSMRVMAVFLRFLAISFSSFLVDIFAFFLIFSVSDDVILSTFIARTVSATLNFLANKLFVFKSLSRDHTIYEVAGYVALAITIASLSAFLVHSAFEATDINVIALKITVDALLFIFSFLIQRYFLFINRY